MRRIYLSATAGTRADGRAFRFYKFVSAVNSTTFNRFACPFHRRKVLFKTIYNWKPIWNLWITSWVIRYSLGAIEPRTGALAFHFYKFVSVVNYTIFHRVTCPIHRWKTLFITIFKTNKIKCHQFGTELEAVRPTWRLPAIASGWARDSFS